MKIFKKICLLNGTRNIYFCGIKIWSYYKPVALPDFSYDIMKFIALGKCHDLKNLVLGSSHGRDGFIPTKFDFNLANSSQDLYRGWKLYEYVAKHNGKKLKNVILFWSVFHAGLQLEKTREFVRCIPYKGLYNITYASKLPIDDKEGMEILKKQKKSTVCPDGFRGKAAYNLIHFNEPTSVLVGKHLKNTMRNNNQIQYLEKIVNKAKRAKHNVYVVLPPYRSDYLKCLPNESVVYRELFDFLNKHKDVKLLNFQRDKDFKDSDFDSPDHCNEFGGVKLTKKIKCAISNF